MKKLASKIITLALAAAFAVTSVPMTAQAAPDYPKSGIVYLTGNDYTTTSLYIYDLAKNDKVKSVKSSAASVAKFNSVTHNASTSSSKTTYADTNMKDSEYNYSDYYASISLVLQKAGKAKISYKIGSKSYSTQLTVKKYTNPAKTVTISGVNSGKNIASKTKKLNNVRNVKVAKKTSNAKVSITANKGWKIKTIDFTNYTTYNMCRMTYGKGGVSSASVNVGTLEKNANGMLYVTFADADGAPITLYYYLSK